MELKLARYPIEISPMSSSPCHQSQLHEVSPLPGQDRDVYGLCFHRHNAKTTHKLPEVGLCMLDNTAHEAGVDLDFL